MSYAELAVIFFAGAVGSLVRVVVKDGFIILPCRVGTTLLLGFVGSLLVGGFVGVVVDGNPVTAALAGYVGVSVLSKVLPEVEKDFVKE